MTRHRLFARNRVLPAVIAALLPVLTASAQQESVQPPVPDAAARYTVEVIVFAYADSSSSGNEVFTPPPPLEPDVFEESPGEGAEAPRVYDDRSPPLEPLAPEESPAEEESLAAEELTGPLQEMPARARIELERLEPEAFQMGETWRRLSQLDAYRPLLHAAWTQTTHDKALSPALPLRTLSDPPLGLDGSITLYQSRFLHLDVDLVLDARDAHEQRDSAHAATDRLVGRDRSPSGQDEARGIGEADGLLQPPVRYRISEDRIVRDGEVRYFDHPRFGMLARISRAEDDEETTTAAD